MAGRPVTARRTAAGRVVVEDEGYHVLAGLARELLPVHVVRAATGLVRGVVGSTGVGVNCRLHRKPFPFGVQGVSVCTTGVFLMCLVYSLPASCQARTRPLCRQLILRPPRNYS